MSPKPLGNTQPDDKAAQASSHPSPEQDAPRILEPASTAGHSDLTIGYAAFLGAVSSLATLGLSMIRTKVAAIFLGPTGLGTAAEIIQWVTLATVPATLIAGPALVRAASAARAEGDRRALERVCSTGLTGILGLGAACGLVAVIAGRSILPSPWAQSAGPLVLLAAIATIAMALSVLPQQLLIAFGELRWLSVVTIAGAAISTVVVAVATGLGGLSGHFMGLAGGAAITAVVAYLLTSRRLPQFSLRPRLGVDWGFAQRVASVGLTSLIAGAATQAALTLIRFVLDKAGGAELNGYFQAAWSISTAYMTIVLSSLGNYVFPRYSTAPTREALVAEVDSSYKFVLRVTPPVVLAVIGIKDILVRVLFAKSFESAVPLLGLLAAGDIARGVAWVVGGPLLYRGKVKAFLLSEVLGAGGVALASALLVPRLGLIGVGYAYALNGIISAWQCSIILRYSCGVPIAWRRLALVSFSVAGAVGLSVFGSGEPILGWLSIVLAVAWAHRSGILRSMAVGLVERYASLRSGHGTRRAFAQPPVPPSNKSRGNGR
ncbi:MAG: oligosaccharide flippase family protein [Myxococcales bacterium]|nr:oligosaccharide flippase family protein [Myxococcales bacterium]